MTASVTLLFSAGGKLAKQEAQLKTMRTVGFPVDKMWLPASAEIAGAAGLIIGLFWWPLGVAAAIGLILENPRVQVVPSHAAALLLSAGE
jgi:hypothetical protein